MRGCSLSLGWGHVLLAALTLTPCLQEGEELQDPRTTPPPPPRVLGSKPRGSLGCAAPGCSTTQSWDLGVTWVWGTRRPLRTGLDVPQSWPDGAADQVCFDLKK